MPPIRVLNVAEKPSVAKEISTLLGGSNLHKRTGKSKYNPVFEFPYQVQGENVEMVFTSVSGHLMENDFVEPYKRNWQACRPIDLFDIGVEKYVPERNNDLKRNLETEARRCSWLILWLDCDREGENIAFEVIEVCKNVKRNLRTLRAQFSKLVYADIKRALESLRPPNQRDSEAVDTRSEFDLRIGAIYTRWQTMYIQGKYSGLENQVISYGPCQFPTLGFVVDRFKRIESFQEEPFWTINVDVMAMDEGQQQLAKFSWERVRLFDRLAVLTLFETCVENPVAQVIGMNQRERRKYRPYPMNTVELQKLASRKLRLSSERTMQIAEKLYQNGYISYPRTETEIFEEGTDLTALIRLQVLDQNWGNFAESLLTGDMFCHPKKGKGNDNSHPPIHPTKHLTADVPFEEKQIYEMVTRHFLACCAKDAIGSATTVTLQIAGEKFKADGLIVLQKNYLLVYKYQKWSDFSIPPFQQGQKFIPDEIRMDESKTQAPSLLSESDLIALMDKNGIGTDATIAQHIQTCLDRGYVEKIGERKLFSPSPLGLALVDGYEAMGLALSKPQLRAQLESQLTLICRGERAKQDVIAEYLQKYKEIFVDIIAKSEILENAMNRYFNPLSATGELVKDHLSTCGRCGQKMSLIKVGGNQFQVHCQACQQGHSVGKLQSIAAIDHICPLCNFQVLKITTVANKSYDICPYCRNHPPEGVESVSMPCFKCTANCPLASGTPVAPVRLCIACKSQGMLIKKINGQYLLGCKNYPTCKGRLSVPGDVKFMASKMPCPRCCSTTSDIITMIVEFSFKRVIPGVGLEYTGCVGGCDSTVNRLFEQSNERFSASAVSRTSMTNSVSSATRPTSSSSTSSFSAPSASTSSAAFRPSENIRFNNANGFVQQFSSASSAGIGHSKSIPTPHGRNFTQSDGMQIIDINEDCESFSKSGNSAPLCYCGLPCKFSYFPPPSASFYSCAKPGNTCAFIKYEDRSATSFASNMSTSTSSHYNSYALSAESMSGGNSIKCSHGIVAVVRTTQKEGPNKGRQFHTCGESDKCNFFLWVDEANGSGSSWDGGSSGNYENGEWSSVSSGTSRKTKRGGKSSRGGNAARGNAKRKRRSNSSTGKGGTKGGKTSGSCFKCNKSGHWANDCPN